MISLSKYIAESQSSYNTWTDETLEERWLPLEELLFSACWSNPNGRKTAPNFEITDKRNFTGEFKKFENGIASHIKSMTQEQSWKPGIHNFVVSFRKYVDPAKPKYTYIPVFDKNEEKVQNIRILCRNSAGKYSIPTLRVESEMWRKCVLISWTK